MAAYQAFDKWRKIMAAKGYLRPNRQIEEFGLVNAHHHAALAAAEIPTDVGCQSQPAVEVVGNAGAQALGIRFQSAGHLEDAAWKQAVHIGVRIDERVSAEDLPFGSRLLLRCRDRAQAAHDAKHRQQRCCNWTTIAL